MLPPNYKDFSVFEKQKNPAFKKEQISVKVKMVTFQPQNMSTRK